MLNSKLYSRLKVPSALSSLTNSYNKKPDEKIRNLNLDLPSESIHKISQLKLKNALDPQLVVEEIKPVIQQAIVNFKVPFSKMSKSTKS